MSEIELVRKREAIRDRLSALNNERNSEGERVRLMAELDDSSEEVKDVLSGRVTRHSRPFSARWRRLPRVDCTRRNFARWALNGRVSRHGGGPNSTSKPRRWRRICRLAARASTMSCTWPHPGFNIIKFKMQSHQAGL